ARPCRQATRCLECKAQMALRVLRHHRQRPSTGQHAILHDPALALLAEPSIVGEPCYMGRVRPYVSTAALAPTENRVLTAPSPSAPVVRRAGCGNSASPDLWEPRGSNPLGPPGSAGQLDFAGRARPRAACA